MGEIAKTREETIAISGKIKEVKGQYLWLRDVCYKTHVYKYF